MEKVRQLADKKGCTLGQLALSWVHHQGDDVFPIPGTKRIKYLEENIAAFNVKLSKQELAEIEEQVPHGQVWCCNYCSTHSATGSASAFTSPTRCLDASCTANAALASFQIGLCLLNRPPLIFSLELSTLCAVWGMLTDGGGHHSLVHPPSMCLILMSGLYGPE